MSATGTRETILHNARSTAQSEGYRAISFRDLADAVGIKSASVHYHFATKEQLGAALMKQYREEAAQHLAEVLDACPDIESRLDAYIRLFRRALEQGNRICLGSMLTAEISSLPRSVREEVQAFAELNLEWLAKVLEHASVSDRTIAARHQARAIFAAISGAQLVAHGQADVFAFDEIVSVYRATGLLPTADTL